MVFGALSVIWALATSSKTAGAQKVASISGYVVDSLAHRGLAGAMVQLLSASDRTQLIRTTVSDSLGYFSLSDVPSGRFVLGFTHEMLDSLRVDVSPKEIIVRDADSLTVSLGIPSARTIIGLNCGGSPGGAVTGSVWRGDGTSTDTAQVVAEWYELSLARNSIGQRAVRVKAHMGSNGYFALCALPTAATIVISAKEGALSTPRIEMEIPDEGLVHRDLYLGEANTRSGDSGNLPLASGEGIIGGLVYTLNKLPIEGAHVSILGGPTTRTLSDGTWALTRAPVGTQVLEVRAVGFYPKRIAVDVSRRPQNLLTELPTLKAILDTIRITATISSDLADFAKRRRLGGGHFLTPADIKRFPEIITSNHLRRIPGVRIIEQNGQRFFEFRGTFEPWCSPNIFVNGHNMSYMSADDLDDYISPEHVAGIEVYTGATIPPQFQVGLSGCGSIVVWTK